MKPPTVTVRVLVLIAVLTTPVCWADDKKKDPDAIGDRDVGIRQIPHQCDAGNRSAYGAREERGQHPRKT